MFSATRRASSVPTKTWSPRIARPRLTGPQHRMASSPSSYLGSQYQRTVPVRACPRLAMWNRGVLVGDYGRMASRARSRRRQPSGRRSGHRQLEARRRGARPPGSGRRAKPGSSARPISRCSCCRCVGRVCALGHKLWRLTRHRPAAPSEHASWAEGRYELADSPYLTTSTRARGPAARTRHPGAGGRCGWPTAPT